MEYQDSTDRPPDALGIASLVCGVLGGAGCMGSCIPYLGVVFMFGSMLLSLSGVILGVMGVVRQIANADSSVLSVGGFVVNGAILLIWLAYWGLVFGAVALVAVHRITVLLQA